MLDGKQKLGQLPVGIIDEPHQLINLDDEDYEKDNLVKEKPVITKNDRQCQKVENDEPNPDQKFETKFFI